MADATCTQCGASPTLEAVQKGQCSYCGTALPHAVQAAAKALMFDALLADKDGDGVPDAISTYQSVQKISQERQETEAEIGRLRDQIARDVDARLGLRSWLLWSMLTASIVGVLWAAITSSAETDPWLGLHARLVCPMSCTGCTGPYKELSWTSTGTSGKSSTTLIYCHHPDAKLTGSSMALMDYVEHNEPYRAIGGLSGLIGSSILSWLLLVLPLMTWPLRRRAASRRAGVAELRRKLQQLESALGASR